MFPSSRERVPFPRDDAPALPTTATTSTSTSAMPGSASASNSAPGPIGGSRHEHDDPGTSSNAVNRSRSLPIPRPGAAGGSGSAIPTSASSTIAGSSRANSTTGSLQSARVPSASTSASNLHHASNAHIPLAMQTRSRNTSDPHRAVLLATAATRAPGSPPQHMQTPHSQAAQTSPSSKQRTPEHAAGQGHTPERRPSDPPRGLEREGSVRAGGGVEREGSFRAESGGAHLTREGSFRTPELALDVKRLLAKPMSVSSVRTRADSSDGASMGGEGAGRASGEHVRRKRYDTGGKRVERVEEERVTKSEDGGSRPLSPLTEREQEKKAREIALALVAPHKVEEKKEKRQKNVLKRRPSAGRSVAPSAATPSPSPSPAPPPATATPARTGPPILSLNLSLNPMPTFAATGGSPPGSGSGSGSGQLTPARAVVQAYKRSLDASPRASPLPSPSSATFRRRQTASDTGHGGFVESPNAGTPSPPATPYYTVFGSTSGRIVAVGGPEDAWDGAGSYISSSAFPMFDGVRAAGAKPPAVGRTLTRKVSERWMRKREDSEDEARGRTSMQGDQRPKKIVRSGSRARADEPLSPAGELDSTWAKSPLGLHHSEAEEFKNEPRSRRSEPALGGGSKIWKLMKRISTGGLKEKYDRAGRNLPPIPPLPPLPNLPPVPQIPKDTLEARTAMSSDGHSSGEPSGTARFMQSRSSLSTSRTSSFGSNIPRSGGRALPMPPPIPASHQPRASTTTRSSSPVSSDVASAKFFPKTTSSARSSTSSFAEDAAAPPLPAPNPIMGKHIVPPKDLFKLDLSEFGPSSLDNKKSAVKPMAFFGTQNLRTPEDWHIVNTPSEELPPSLPHPPRRLPVPSTAKERPVSNNRFSHVSIPEFSTAAPINAFTTRKTPGEAARVENVLASLSQTPSRRMSSALDDRQRRHPPLDERQKTSSSTATSYASTARQKRMQQRSTSLPRAEPKFRDMSEAQVLTEKEKADRWDDLLQRSDRAGGTIHLGTSEQLPSDNVSLRFSTTSTQLLNDF
ncbi:hypothetical protein B0H16DRAFT_134993 [Mycena metata]|uniref:Uncharacterized protein n=1 Tax=Mycena metata TaxID=1033252 RepID=A0AAD7MW87_9AGAR|nr:hypothetical protein B0H16DRAFT_134993 [Mycena metata]